MKNTDQKIEFIKSADKGKGLPFAIVDSETLLSSDDLFKPSLRDFHVVFWVKKGVGSYFVDFQEYRFKPGIVILLPKDQVSYFERYNPDLTDIQSIVFSPGFIYRSDSDLNQLFQFTMASHIEGVQIIELDEKDTEYLEMLSGNMKKVYHKWNLSVKESAFYHWLSIFLIYCGQLQVNAGINRPLNESRKRLLHFNQVLESNYRKQFKVDFYLDKLGISVKALSKLTKEHYRMSPKTVIDERRVLELKRRLKGTTQAVKAIAYDLGFDEPTNMIKYFKKHTGFTPAGFRENEITRI